MHGFGASLPSEGIGKYSLNSEGGGKYSLPSEGGGKYSLPSAGRIKLCAQEHPRMAMKTLQCMLILQIRDFCRRMINLRQIWGLFIV